MSSRISAEAVSVSSSVEVHTVDRAETSESVSPLTLARDWRLFLGLLAAVMFWAVAYYWGTATSMASIWWTSETFAHGLVIYPAVLWLSWRKWPVLRQMQPRPCYWALIPIGALGLGWLAASLGGVQAGQHLCFVAMISLLPWAILGTRVAREIAFPLACGLFAAPIGEFLTPIMMERTADFTVAALRITGVPVYREGLHFVVSSGHWSVVEACSGLRYLIASMVLGCLFAYLSYRSYWRRTAFVVAATLTPILANWIRAYMIVMIGHTSGMKLAVGIDHLIYGWVFFGLVMLALFWIGSRWTEQPAAVVSGARHPRAPEAVCGFLLHGAAVALLTAGVVSVWPQYERVLDESLVVRPVTLTLSSSIGQWHQVERPNTFQPRYAGTRARTLRTYTKDGKSVDLFVGYYAVQTEGSELINFNNRLVVSSDPTWTVVNEHKARIESASLPVVQTSLSGGGRRLTVWQWYWVGGRWTSSRIEAKYLHSLSRLRGEGDDAAVVVLSSEAKLGDREAEAVLTEFVGGFLPKLKLMLETTRTSRAGISTRLRVAEMSPDPETDRNGR